jgi:hypothetical protein
MTRDELFVTLKTHVHQPEEWEHVLSIQLASKQAEKDILAAFDALTADLTREASEHANTAMLLEKVQGEVAAKDAEIINLTDENGKFWNLLKLAKTLFCVDNEARERAYFRIKDAVNGTTEYDDIFGDSDRAKDAEIEKLKWLLKKQEYNANDSSGSCLECCRIYGVCGECENSREQGHAPGCELAAAIGGEKP